MDKSVFGYAISFNSLLKVASIVVLLAFLLGMVLGNIVTKMGLEAQDYEPLSLGKDSFEGIIAPF